MNRRNQILAGVLVLQLVVAGICFLSRLAPATFGSKPLVEGLAAGKKGALNRAGKARQRIDGGQQDGGGGRPQVGGEPASQSKNA